MKKSLLKLLMLPLAVLLGATLAWTLSNNKVLPHKADEFASVTAMITRYDGRSGGSGVVLTSRTGQSTVLTNAHVCRVVANGGIVSTDNIKGVVKSIQMSNVHDLCLITVNTNFRVNTQVANKEPEIYEDAVVSGHPHLLSTIVTKGHFSKKELITIMTNIRACTLEEISGPEGIICMLLGGIPVVRTYEAQVVSNTIQPGSSGSAVFNSRGEIAGLVFAGSGDFGYGHIVPYEYIKGFLETEIPILNITSPNEEAEAMQVKQQNWKTVCVLDDARVQNICGLLERSLLIY